MQAPRPGHRRRIKVDGERLYLDVTRECWPLCDDCEHCHGEDGSSLVRSDKIRGRVCLWCDSALDEMGFGSEDRAA